MDYLDHHSKLMNADFLGNFDSGTRVKMVDCILVIAEDIRGELPADEFVLIAISHDSAHVVQAVETEFHMLCVRRKDLERTAFRMFPEDLARTLVQTLFPIPHIAA